MYNVFTYGSLMFGEVWQSIVSGQYTSQPAKINGFARKQVSSQTYPALVTCTQNNPSVIGQVYFGVSQEDLNRLDVFEGEEYERLSLPILLENGETIHGETYVFKQEFLDRVLDTDWSLSHFKQQGLTEFLQDYVGFKSL